MLVLYGVCCVCCLTSFHCTSCVVADGRGRGEGKGDRDRERDTVEGRQENKVYQGKSDVRERDNNSKENRGDGQGQGQGQGPAPVKSIMSPIGPQSSHGRGGVCS